ncbi:hypothetical protein [Pseudalkalibacillus sp. SCS-8]|uniref:hypothetical protein n=1 Tax=Pseudalkalibacillus nanhaiensis TaxID=3115291 RepID=UPI0032DA3269
MRENWLFPLLLFIFVTGCSTQQTPQVSADSKTIQSIMPPQILLQTKEHSSLHSVLGSYEWSKEDQSSEQTVRMDNEPPHILAKDLKPTMIERGKVVTIRFNDSESKPSLNVHLWGEDGEKEEVSINESKLTLPEKKGQYIYEITCEWPQGNASYIFVAEIK